MCVCDLLSAWCGAETHGAETHDVRTYGPRCGKARCENVATFFYNAYKIDGFKNAGLEVPVGQPITMMW